MLSLLIIAGVDTLLAITLVLRLVSRLDRYRPPQLKMDSLDVVPTVSICIPARNEKHAMTQCLERVLASDYKKLEIIVFDDSSDDETSILIKSFAHAGVRFVPGTKLPDGWLGRVHALDILAREASGDYLLFLDVDTFITPSTVRKSVATMLQADKTMLSVLPSRNDVWRASVLFGTLRYFWQLVASSYQRPTASGAFWLVQRDELQKVGGLARFKNEVLAETKLAALFGSSYMYVIDSGKLGVSYEKKWRSQVETSRRIMYPLVPGVQSIGALVGLLFLQTPILGEAVTLLLGWWLLSYMFGLLTIAFMLIYGLYTHAVWRNNWWLGALFWPVLIVQDLIVFIQSIVGYMRHTISWKGRPITAAPTNTESITINQ